MEHIFEKNAFLYPVKNNEPDMSNYEYDTQKGYWINIRTNILLINDKNGPRPQSKKCDQETGEDRKSE